jgi:hypothetical protein
MSLYLRVHRRTRWRSSASLDAEFEFAGRLFDTFTSINLATENQTACCSTLLLCATCDMVALLGPAAGRITLRTDVGDVVMPCFKRRAVILLVCELIANALQHAFNEEDGGEITVALEAISGTCARVTVADNGCGFGQLENPPVGDVTAALAGILNGSIVYDSTRCYATVVSVEFPLNQSVAVHLLRSIQKGK